MEGANLRWTPGDPRSWATRLGLVYLPLFGPRKPGKPFKDCGILLDGSRSSFAICRLPKGRPDFGNVEPLDWCWSSNVQHLVLLAEQDGEMFLRRWDSEESIRRFRLPERAAGADALLAKLAEVPLPRDADVVLHMLRAFRRLRASIPSRNALDAVRVFDGLLVGTETARRDDQARLDWARRRSVREAISDLPEGALEAAGLDRIEPTTADVCIGDLLSFFLEPEPRTGRSLIPSLLLRHASGQLYQEAHFEIERGDQYLPGLALEEAPTGILRKDVRFTPTPLARALVEEALSAAGPGLLKKDRLTVLDPACGSGVFLQESLRELAARRYSGTVVIRGFDTSDISCAMARFCLWHAAKDAKAAGMSVESEIAPSDALAEAWGTPDIIVMNPPFVDWEGMEAGDKDRVLTVLGPLARGRVDKAMAFVWKGMKAVSPGGAMATIIPSALLETNAGRAWREELGKQGSLWLLGRFEGYGFFRGSIVEPAIIVMRAKNSHEDQEVRVLLSRDGGEEAAIRGLRQQRQAGEPVSATDWELFSLPQASLTPASWVPRPSAYVKRLEAFAAADMSRVGDLFRVRQGARTGLNEAFIIRSREWGKLDPSEQRFFRPAASNATIRDGRIFPEQFIFYPYDESGLTIKSEDDLEKSVPTFYERRLRPRRDSLEARRGTEKVPWWGLVRERVWQRHPVRKLVTKYFGRRGGFAYDGIGEYVVVQGHAWFWKGRRLEDTRNLDFYATPLPWAYVGLLNSPVFEALLGCFCPTVQGGQFNLSPRFVTKVFLPDLSDDLRTPADVVAELAEIGQAMRAGTWPDAGRHARAAARAYGIPLEELQQWVSR